MSIGGIVCYSPDECGCPDCTIFGSKMSHKPPDPFYDQRAELIAERDELRELLVASVPEDLVCYATIGCPECGETMTGRLGTELKIQRDQALSDLNLEKVRYNTANFVAKSALDREHSLRESLNHQIALTDALIAALERCVDSDFDGGFDSSGVTDAWHAIKKDRLNRAARTTLDHVETSPTRVNR
jgi:hypothetical protein